MKKIIGDTPLIKINYKINNDIKSIYAKLEWYSLTGSIKDRMVNYVIEKSKEEGLLKEEQAIVETSSGNTGISLAALGALNNHKVIIFMPENVSKERIEIIKLYGAEVNLVKINDGGFIKCLELSKEYAKKHDAFLFNQFKNKYNTEAQKEIGREILDKLDNIENFVSGIGSGGTAMGVFEVLKKESVKLVVVEPRESQILNGKSPNKHKIEGIGDDFIPEIVNIKNIEKTVDIKSDDAILVSQKLAKEIGLGVGISSGANILASILINNTDKKVVTVLADDLKKYISTDLSKYNKTNNYIESIKFLNYEVL